MRAWIGTLGLGLFSCAGVPATPDLDPAAHARLTVAGFREASPFVAARLDAAVAWAVFPDVEDASEACAHAGTLFRPDAPPRAARLRCGARPPAPAGTAYHVVVILEDPADLERLAAGALDLADAPHLAPHDDHPPPAGDATRWVVTSERAGLLFRGWSPRHTLELVRDE